MAMYLTFSGAAREVTGSCHLLEVGGARALVDCGLIQGAPADEARNRDPFPFNPADIDAVILTHAHLDHSGRLPLLIKAGFTGPVYAHGATRDLCEIMLRDAGYLNEKEVEWTNAKRRRKGLEPLNPLYTMLDARAAMHNFQALPYGAAPVEILPGVRVRLQDAGHILGSAIAEVWLRDGKHERKLVFSGDLGHSGAPILQDPVRVPEADLVIMESTYGDRLHRSWESTWQELESVLDAALRGRGNILIPAFAVGRTQELLYALGERYSAWGLDRWAIFLDSPLAIEATEVYSRHPELYDTEASAARQRAGSPFRPPNLYFSRTSQQSMAINRIRSGAIVIAGSGMCDGGRIKHHLKHNVWRDNCHIIIVGFQAPGTIGRQLVDGARYIRLWGETVRVEARVHTIGGFSAHADQRELLAWYGGFRDRPRVALVHGDAEAMDTLGAALDAAGSRAVIVPARGSRLDLADYRLRAPRT